MTTLLRDVRLGVRALRRQPAFTLVAVLTIALGIGATTAIFSVVNAVLLRPLPYTDAERLAIVWTDLRARDLFNFPWPPADFHDLRERATLFEEVAGLNTFEAAIAEQGSEPERIRVAMSTHNLFSLLGARIVLGRGFDAADATPLPPPPEPVPGAAPQAPPPLPGLLSHGFWQRRFGGDPGVIGRSLELGNQRVEIIGVVEPGFELHFPPGTGIERNPDIFAPYRMDFAAGSRINVFLRVVARLRPGVSFAAAQTQLDGLAAELRQVLPIKEAAGLQIRVEPMHADIVRAARPTLLALMGAVIFVLLIACANVANLLLVRAAGRERELAVHAALGGSRWRLAAQVLAESAALAFAGALGGLGLAAAGIRVLQRIGPADLPRADSVAIDPVVLGFTAAAAFAAAFLFGVMPAWRASRADVGTALRSSGRSGAGLAGGGRALRSGVVVAEVALSFVLLVGSGLMLRSFATLQSIDPGFDADGVLTFVAPPPQPGEVGAQYARSMREQLGALPGVEAVTAANALPLDGALANARWGTAAAAEDPDLFQQAQVHFVLPGYFETLRTPLLAGRTFEQPDDDPQSMNVVIDEVLARKAFGSSRAAVGERLLIRVRTDEPEWFEVVGVVAQQRHTTLAEENRETIFFTNGQLGFGTAIRWAVRVAGRDPLAITPAVRAAITGIAPLVAVDEVQAMSTFVDRAMAGTRFTLVLIGVFAVIAALLAAIGLYWVLSTVVRQRTAEIGVRMAFGAEPGAIGRHFVGEGLRLSAAGIGIGAIAAFAVTRMMSSMLIGVSPTDPLTFAAMALLFAVIAATASLLPSRRAAKLDPLVALRE